jgi:hypothetical protein
MNSYTNAVDLAILAKNSYDYQNQNKSLQKIYHQVLRTKKYLPRTNLYFNENLNFIGKTGSIGFGFFVNDCGVLEYRGTPVAIVGFVTSGCR